MKATSKAEAEATAAAEADAQKTGKKKTMKEQPEAPAAKMKAGKGKGAAPKAKGKAAAPKAKAKGKPSIFDINSWIAAHVTRAEAKSEPKTKKLREQCSQKVEISCRPMWGRRCPTHHEAGQGCRWRIARLCAYVRVACCSINPGHSAVLAPSWFGIAAHPVEKQVV